MPEPLITHDDVARTLPPSIRGDFLPPPADEYAFICSFAPSNAYLVPYSEVQHLGHRFAP